MKEQFTPGPWDVCRIKHYHPQLIGETCCVKIGENILELDYIGLGNENKDYKQSEANAFLIAAAPEMYEALSDICKVFKKDGRFPKTWPEIEKLLRKARGEE